MRDNHDPVPHDENAADHDLTDQDKGYLSMVRQARERRLAFEQQLDVVIRQALADTDGDPDQVMERLVNPDPASDQGAALLEAFVEMEIVERLRRVQRDVKRGMNRLIQTVYVGGSTLCMKTNRQRTPG